MGPDTEMSSRAAIRKKINRPPFDEFSDVEFGVVVRMVSVVSWVKVSNVSSVEPVVVDDVVDDIVSVVSWVEVSDVDNVVDGSGSYSIDRGILIGPPVPRMKLIDEFLKTG